MASKSKNIYVAGTRDRLFVSQGYDNEFMLIDKRGNVYETANTMKDILNHIENFVKLGHYTAI